MRSAPALLALFVAAFFFAPAEAEESPYRFAQDLRVGSSGQAVYELQRYLNASGFSLASTGPGSPGNETDHFGPLTRAAVAAFQDAHASDILAPLGLARGTGNFFSATRAYVNAHRALVQPDAAPEGGESASRRRGGKRTTYFTVGGEATNVSGSLVLRNNGGDDLALSGSGSFTFAGAIRSGAAYLVTVLSQPAGQECTPTGASGVVSGRDVTDVSVRCLSFPTLGAFADVLVSPATGVATYTLTDPTSDSDGAFTYQSDDQDVATVSGNVVTAHGAGGVATITATQAADGLYAASSTTATIEFRTIDQCATLSPCNGGTCTRAASVSGGVLDSFACSDCPAGRSGDSCENTSVNCDPGSPGECQNGGTCVPDASGGSCSCPVCYTGDACQLDDLACA